MARINRRNPCFSRGGDKSYKSLLPQALKLEMSKGYTMARLSNGCRNSFNRSCLATIVKSALLLHFFNFNLAEMDPPNPNLAIKLPEDNSVTGAVPSGLSLLDLFFMYLKIPFLIIFSIKISDVH